MRIARLNLTDWSAQATYRCNLGCRVIAFFANNDDAVFSIKH
jgi:hypothetical protein